VGDGQTVVVEYSSPNIAKPFHVGHAFTTILGQAIYRLYDHLGYRTVRVNHLGDYGTQFGKLIVAYRLWGDEQAVTADPIRELLRIYVRFHDEAKERPELEDQGREAFRQLEAVRRRKKLVRRSRSLPQGVFCRLRTVGDSLGILHMGEYFDSDRIRTWSDCSTRGHPIRMPGCPGVMLERVWPAPCLPQIRRETIYASRDWRQCVPLGAVPLHAQHRCRRHARPCIPPGFCRAGQGRRRSVKNCVHVGFGLVKFPVRMMS
jgi:arginyl-tRNA synthetase